MFRNAASPAPEMLMFFVGTIAECRGFQSMCTNVGNAELEMRKNAIEKKHGNQIGEHAIENGIGDHVIDAILPVGYQCN